MLTQLLLMLLQWPMLMLMLMNHPRLVNTCEKYSKTEIWDNVLSKLECAQNLRTMVNVYHRGTHKDRDKKNVLRQFTKEKTYIYKILPEC